MTAFSYLRGGGRSDVFNCGYGQCYSVKEVIAAIVMILVFVAPVAARSFEDLQQRLSLAALGLKAVGWTIAVALVLVYLRPINQFIYFQF